MCNLKYLTVKNSMFLKTMSAYCYTYWKSKKSNCEEKKNKKDKKIESIFTKKIAKNELRPTNQNFT